MTILPAIIACSAPSAGEGGYGELTPEDLANLERQAARWVLELEEEQRPRARPLSAAEKGALAGFFDAALLDRARLREVAAIENPAFYTEFFRRRRLPLPIDFSQAAGLALVDTVLVVSERVPHDSPGWLPLVFHELVHLAQAAALGREAQVLDYVRSWAAHGFEYRDIPQEAQAYELAARFRSAPERPFPVAEEVARVFGAPANEAAPAARP